MGLQNCTLAERNGWLYVKWEDTDYSRPVLRAHYWPTGMRFIDLCNRFSDTERARERIGKPLDDIGNGWFEDAEIRVLRYHLPNGNQTQAEFTEVTPVPEPVQRGKKLETRWYQGYWQKHTATRGWVRA